MNKVFKYKFHSAIYLSAVICLWGMASCKKDKERVPEVYVEYYMYSTDPEFSPLNAVGGYIYISSQGSRGIIVYRKSQTEFMAYDRHCPYNVPDGNSVTVDASGLIAADAACNSKFLLTDGSPNSGPATYPLKRYQTTFDGSVLHIFN